MRWLVLLFLALPVVAQIKITGGAKVSTTSSAPPPPPAGLVISAACPVGALGMPYSCTVTATGGQAPYSFVQIARRRRLIRMPPGLTLGSDGRITGTPTQVGAVQATVQVTDAASATATGVVSITIEELQRTPTLPQTWANPHEADLPGSGVATKTIKVSGGDYPCTLAGLQASMNDWAAQPANVWWHVLVDDGTTGSRCVIDTGSGWIWKPKTSGVATGFIVYESAHPNATGRTVCNRVAGIDLIGPSPRNPGCDTTPGIDDLAHTWGLTSSNLFGNGPIINMINQRNAQGYGATHIVLRDAEITYTRVNYSPNVITFVTCESVAVSGSCTAQETVQHIGFERNYLHTNWGDLGRNPVGCGNTNGCADMLVQTSNLVLVGCGHCWFEWNYFEAFGRLAEGHGFSMTQAQPGVKIAHNFMEGGEIGLLSGGALTFLGPASSDVEVRQNFWTMNPAWMYPQPGYGLGYLYCRSARKNAFELKSGQRWLVNGNVMENSIACGQSGQLLLNNTFPGGPDDWMTDVSDITFTNNVFRHAVMGVLNRGRSGSQAGNGDGVGRPGRRWSYINNLFYDINQSLQRTGTTTDLLTNGSTSQGSWNCNATRDAAGAITTLTNCVSNQLATQPTWNLRTGTVVGDPVWVGDCTPSSFNTNHSVLGPPALAGTNGLVAGSQIVVYANPGTPNEQGAGCTYRNAFGWPAEVTQQHNTYVVAGPISYPKSNGMTEFGCSYQRGATVRDELVINSPNYTASDLYIASACGQQGSAGQSLLFDVNTLFFQNMYFSWTGRAPSKTVLTYPGGYNQASSSNTVWLATAQGQQICPGATADINCVGMNGLMNGATWIDDPQTDPLIFYALAPSSVYKAGGTRQAHDGTDMGADMNKIRTAMHELIYSGCTGSDGTCGAGPNPD